MGESADLKIRFFWLEMPTGSAVKPTIGEMALASMQEQDYF